MKISIKYQHNEQPITVYGGWLEDEDFLIDWCNHAGATEEPEKGMQVFVDSHGELDTRDVASWVKVCDKCKAWFDPMYGMWED